MIKQKKIIVPILTFFLVRGKLKVKVFPSSPRSGKKNDSSKFSAFFPHRPLCFLQWRAADNKDNS